MMVLCCSDVDVGDAGDADNEGVSCRGGDVTAARIERLDCDKGSPDREIQIAVGRQEKTHTPLTTSHHHKKSLVAVKAGSRQIWAREGWEPTTRLFRARKLQKPGFRQIWAGDRWEPAIRLFPEALSPAVCVATFCRSLISLVVGLVILVVGSEPSRVDNVLLSCT